MSEPCPFWRIDQVIQGISFHMAKSLTTPELTEEEKQKIDQVIQSLPSDIFELFKKDVEHPGISKKFNSID